MNDTTQKLKGFISYAHADEQYFTILKEGFLRHGKHSTVIGSNLWTDKKILLGTQWHQTIQQQVQECDFAIFLVSANFLYSEYIEKFEFDKFIERQEREGFLFFPILIDACRFDTWPQLSKHQFFKPNGKNYGMPETGNRFVFGDLVQFNIRGELLPNPNRERYIMDALTQMEASLREHQQKEKIQNTLPPLKYFHVQSMTDIKPMDFLATRAKPDQGFLDYYFHRPYLDNRLKYNQEKQKATIITGKPLAGKTRSVYELCNGIPNKENFLLLRFNRQDIEQHDFLLPPENFHTVLFIDDFERFVGIENIHWALEKALVASNIWVVATCRKDQLALIKSQFSHLYHNFEVKEIQPLSNEERKTIEKASPNKTNKRSDGTIGSYYLPLDEMKERFDRLPEEGLERIIFHACRALQYWGNGQENNGYKISKIKEYCHRHLRYHFNIEREISLFEWEQAFKHLNRMNLLNASPKQEVVFVEDLYLERFITKDETFLRQEILRYFPSVINFTKFVYRALNWNDALNIIQTMKREGLKPNEVTYSSLLTKAPNWNDALNIIQTMKREGLKPNEVTYNSLLTKAP
ncbi:MAG: TIR domain-containing protein, partial [Bacteroidota bacterium]